MYNRLKNLLHGWNEEFLIGSRPNSIQLRTILVDWYFGLPFLSRLGISEHILILELHQCSWQCCTFSCLHLQMYFPCFLVLWTIVFTFSWIRFLVLHVHLTLIDHKVETFCSFSPRSLSFMEVNILQAKLSYADFQNN